MVPKRAVAISIPIANAISFPLNHFTIIFETVIPAISTPTPKIAYPKAAKPTCVSYQKMYHPQEKLLKLHNILIRSLTPSEYMLPFR